MLVPLKSSPAVLVMARSKSVSICNHSRARLVGSSRNRAFRKGYANLMRSYGGLILEPRGSNQRPYKRLRRLYGLWSNLTPLKSRPTFNAEKFHTQVILVYLEWFRRNSVLKCVLQPKIAKNSLKPLFWGSRSFKVIDVGTTGKLVGSACYDKQQVCVYLQPFSRQMSQL